MNDINVVVFTCTVLGGADVRYTQAGKRIANLPVQIDKTYMKEGEQYRRLAKIDVTIWGNDEAVSSLKRGDRLLIQATIGSQEWTSQNGKLIRKTVIETFVAPIAMRSEHVELDDENLPRDSRQQEASRKPEPEPESEPKSGSKDFDDKLPF